MKVGELIERLMKFPREAEVLVGTDEMDYCEDIKQVIYMWDGQKETVRILQEEVVQL